MTQPDFARAVALIRERLAEVEGIRNVVLFGSVAKGTATESSDLDLLVVANAEAREEVSQRTHDIESETSVRISTIFVESLEGTDRQMLDALLRDGVTLVGEDLDFGVGELALEPWRLVRYDLTRLSPREKVRLSRTLYGYATTKTRGEKAYRSEHRGFLSRVSGKRVGRGAFLVPEKAAPEADGILRAAGASRIMIPLWIQRP